MMRSIGAALFLGRLVCAQGIDPTILIDNYTPRIAADSRGNLVTLQQTAATGAQSVYTVYRYDSHGQPLQTLNGANQLVDAVGQVVFMTLDSADNIYVGAYASDGSAMVVRPSDPPNQMQWKISGALTLRGMAFDPEGNPLVLSSDLNTGHMQVVKFDRGTGQILNAYSFASFWDYPSVVATDNSGAVYIAGATSSPNFPITAGAWPSQCQTVANGSYDCSEAFVVKIDSGLQRVAYSSLLAAGGSSAMAVAADGSVYAGGVPGFLVKLNSQGLVIASSNAFPGGVEDLKLDSSGNLLVIGTTTSGSTCGPDRANLGGSSSATFVAKLDSQLAGISPSALIPQQAFFLGPAALLADGTLYLPVQPAQTTQEFSGVDFVGARVLHVSPNASPSPVTCVVNGATYLAETAVAPGQLLTIFGQGLGSSPGMVFDASQQLPLSAQGISVNVGGLAAPLLYISVNQINAIVPYGIKPGAQAPIEIRRDGSIIYTWTVDAITQNPSPLLRFGANGALTPDDQTQPVVPLAAAVNQDGTPNGRQNPAHTGSVVTVYATGYGQLTPAAADGAPVLIPTAVSNGNGIQSWSGILQPSSVSTIPGWTNAVVAVSFQVPNTGLPGIADLVFRLAPSVSNQNVPAAFIYATQ